MTPRVAAREGTLVTVVINGNSTEAEPSLRMAQQAGGRSLMGNVEKIAALVAILGMIIAGVTEFNSLDNRIANLEKQNAALEREIGSMTPAMGPRSLTCIEIGKAYTQAALSNNAAAMVHLNSESERLECASMVAFEEEEPPPTGTVTM